MMMPGHQNQNSLLVTHQLTYIHQGHCVSGGMLTYSPYLNVSQRFVLLLLLLFLLLYLIYLFFFSSSSSLSIHLFIYFAATLHASHGVYRSLWFPRVTRTRPIWFTLATVTHWKPPIWVSAITQLMEVSAKKTDREILKRGIGHCQRVYVTLFWQRMKLTDCKSYDKALFKWVVYRVTPAKMYNSLHPTLDLVSHWKRKS